MIQIQLLPKIISLCLLANILIAGTWVKAQTKVGFDIETGVVFKGPYNEIRVPGNGGTTFDVFGPGFQTDPKWFYRIRAGVTFKDRHTLTALYAPLTIESVSQGELLEPIIFRNSTFETGKPLNVSYTFNSYRLTYRYNFIREEKIHVGIGLTAKIRDAAIELSNGETTASRTNVGLVPLINLYLNWLPAERFGILLEGDGFAVPGFSTGRAFDIFAGIHIPIIKNFSVKAGYRVLEGGVNIDSDYNFNWVNYGSLGLVWNL